MIISLIVAIDENGLMGVNQELPWHLPNDLKYFKEKTLNKPVIMGRNTYESMGRALPNRINVVLSTNPLTFYRDAITVTHIDDALEIAKLETTEECFIIGGASIFHQAFKTDLINKVYLTIVETKIPTDDWNHNVYFNKFYVDDWDLKSATIKDIDEKNEFKTHYLIYEKD